MDRLNDPFYQFQPPPPTDTEAARTMRLAPVEMPMLEGGGASAPRGGGATFAFAAAPKTIDEDVYIASINTGRIYIPLTLTATLLVGGVTPGALTTHTYAWLNVVWDTSYVPTSATIVFGSAWPTDPYDVAAKFVNIPLAFVDTDGVLQQATTGNILLSPTFVVGGVILAPASF